MPLDSFEWTEADLPTASALGAATASPVTTRSLVVALIPAHNEEEQIEAAIESLHGQASPPNLVVVCADNCTDRTAQKAEAMGAFVFATREHRHKKAGALNQVLEIVLPELQDDDAVLVMDADSVLAPTFLAEAPSGRRRRRRGHVHGALRRRLRRHAAAERVRTL